MPQANSFASGERLLPPVRIPHLETGVIASQHDLATQFQLIAVLLGNDNPSLFVAHQVLAARVKLASEFAALRWCQSGVLLYFVGHPPENFRRHHHQKTAIEIRYGKELVHLTLAPARWDRDAIFSIHRVPKFAGKDWLGSLRRLHTCSRSFSSTIFHHNAPFLPT